MSRTLPYSTPRRRQKHYRTTTRAILRALGAASYLNGSQFAILWTNSSGQSEVFSTDLFQQRLGAWFPDKVLGEARDLVLATQAARDARILALSSGPPPVAVVTDVFGPTGGPIRLLEHPAGDALDSDDDSDDGDLVGLGTTYPRSRAGSVSHSQPRSRSNSAASHTHLPSTSLRPVPYANGMTTPASPPSSASAPTRVTRSLSMLSVTSHASSPAESPYPSPHLPSASKSHSSPTHSSQTFTPRSLAQWYTEKFKALPEPTINRVCRTWINIVEPNMEARFPYREGSSPPPWWPLDVRHMEPDRLVTAEKITLLATTLRATGIAASRLEVATEGDASMIPQPSLNILREIYAVAKEEQKALRANNHAPFEKLTVLLPIPARPEDEGDLTKSSRHRSRRSNNSTDDVAPRPRATHAPYQLSRSNSVSDVHSSSTTPSRGMSRSHSMTASLSASGRTRRPRDTDEDSYGGSLESPFSGSLQMLQPAINLFSQDVRPPPRHSTPGSHTASPRLGSSDQATLRSHQSPTEGFGRLQEPSFASPAMIKSRSRLSQQPMPMVPISEAAHLNNPQVYRHPQHSVPHPHPVPEPIHIQVHAGHMLEQHQYPTGYPTPTHFHYPAQVQELPPHPQFPPPPSHPQNHTYPNHPHPNQPDFQPHFRSDNDERLYSQEAQAQQLHHFLHTQAIDEEAQRSHNQQLQHQAQRQQPFFHDATGCMYDNGMVAEVTEAEVREANQQRYNLLAYGV